MKPTRAEEDGVGLQFFADADENFLWVAVVNVVRHVETSGKQNLRRGLRHPGNPFTSALVVGLDKILRKKTRPAYGGINIGIHNNDESEAGAWTPGARSNFVQRIAGWVAMSRPLEIYLYEWWPLRRRGQIFEKLSRMRVEVRKRATDAPRTT